jgi:hypothetical protein
LPKSTEVAFKDWYEGEIVDTTWLAELPCVHPQLPGPFDGSSGNPTYGDPEPAAPDEWDEPISTGTSYGVVWPNYYHWGATYEMRSARTAGGHGHQATYNANGQLITDSNCPVIGPKDFPCVSAGSADKSHYSNVLFDSHLDNDVLPFIRAAQLDGNPVNRTGPATDLTRPLIRVGENIQKYFKVRPTVARLPSGRGVCGQ